MSAPEQIWAYTYDMQNDDMSWSYDLPAWVVINPSPILATQYTRTDLIPAMIREAVQHEFAELMDAVRSIADDNNRIDMDVFDVCEAIIRARKGGEA